MTNRVILILARSLVDMILEDKYIVPDHIYDKAKQLNPWLPVSGSDARPCPFCKSIDIDPEGWLARDSKGNETRGPECMGCGATARTLGIWNGASQSTVKEGQDD